MQIRFSGFTLDLDTRQLTEHGREIHVSPKAFELLTLLASERPKVLSKDVLQQRLWPETFVAEANVSNLVAEIRRALRDPARAPRFVRTSHGTGYAFCGVVDGDAAIPARVEPSSWLEWGQRRFQLTPGENIVGRDPDASVRLDASTVSRRHARLIVSPDRVTLEDLASKNGTFVNDGRISAPVELADGHAVGFGTLVVTFRTAHTLPSTETLARTAST